MRPGVLLLALAMACGNDPGGSGTVVDSGHDGDGGAVLPGDGGGEVPDESLRWELALVTGSRTTADVDLLFVVDDSRSNVSPQLSRLIGQGDQLFDDLTEALGVEPNLHVGVVTTNLGSGGYELPGCVGDGDGGVLQNTPRTPGCSPPDGRFLVDVADPGGGRVRNYTGSFGEALACIGDVSRDGCGFEQPLEAMRRALDGSNPENDGFLRDDAFLAVILVTDEDDCSASDAHLFAPPSGPDDPLGALSSFRCFEHGVVCDPDTPREPGRYYDCASREDSVYLHPVAEYREFLLSLKADPAMVYVHQVSGMFPWAEVALGNDGEPALVESCDATDLYPDWPALIPAWRLHTFTRSFAGRSEATSLCQLYSADVGNWPMEVIAPRVGRRAGGATCLMGQLWDSDPLTPQTQPVCRAFDVTGLWSSSETRMPIASCDEVPGQRPCFTLHHATSCVTDRDYSLRAIVFRAQAAPPASYLVVECLHRDWAIR